MLSALHEFPLSSSLPPSLPPSPSPQAQFSKDLTYEERAQLRRMHRQSEWTKVAPIPRSLTLMKTIWHGGRGGSANPRAYYQIRDC